MMTYGETLDFLYSQVPMFQNLGAGAYKPGLETTLALAAHWGNPHTRLREAIHVGGTNGKGSTAHTIAAVLQAAGYKVGLYTSPHLLDFRERIRINGEMIGEESVVRFVDEFMHTPSLLALHPTFFELTTIMALHHFAENEVDVAVIEVGLGGRLDCTNIITPCLSIITNISLDHTALLGHTEPEIAVEKAGIIKKGIQAVIGTAAGDVRRVFEEKCASVGAPLAFACDTRPYASAEFETDGIIYKGTSWGAIRGELSGECQLENTATILTALDFICRRFPAVEADAVRHGFAHVGALTGLAGRWMQLQSAPVRVICDTGHNIGGWRHLGPSLCAIADKTNLHMVLGFVNDKDVAAIMGCMPSKARYYFASPSVKRGRPASETRHEAAVYGLMGEAYADVESAYRAAMDDAVPGDTVFVGGSTFVVADLLGMLRKA